MARDKGGNTLNQATPLTPNAILRDSIGGRDRFDYFRLNVQRRSSIRAILSNPASNVALTLFRNRTAIAQSARPGSRSQQINAALEPGTYFLRVLAQGRQTAYQLSLASSALATPVPSPGRPTLGALFYSDEFGLERLPPTVEGFNLLYVGFPSIASYFGDEPDYARAVIAQYPLSGENLAITSISMSTTRQGSELLTGAPDRIFINSRGERRFFPGTVGYSGFKPSGPQYIYYPNWLRF
ncbi:MAG: hypothetical protein HY785_15285 [Oscillatoriophycideae cyanobacterium NC_groundwater_1537_Pr4_S-0.65um_50_18]|nr:hypothetical protein [Oscillatoriophycideae cyanobacterium NC_groundwater_1537_Pr4_S-0.65um_50_18]